MIQALIVISLILRAESVAEVQGKKREKKREPTMFSPSQRRLVRAHALMKIRSGIPFSYKPMSKQRQFSTMSFKTLVCMEMRNIVDEEAQRQRRIKCDRNQNERLSTIEAELQMLKDNLAEIADKRETAPTHAMSTRFRTRPCK